jgi:hypothetical protein
LYTFGLVFALEAEGDGVTVQIIHRQNMLLFLLVLRACISRVVMNILYNIILAVTIIDIVMTLFVELADEISRCSFAGSYR